jgi:predicted transcriptional regulator
MTYDTSAGALDVESGPEVDALRTTIAEQEAQIARLRERLSGYEQGRFIRVMKWLHDSGLGRRGA